jgi:hypothetical protein
LCPQVVGSSVEHIARGSGVPMTTFWQVPARPATLQAWHDGQVPVMQQTPSVQVPLWHSVLSPQLAPSGFGPQLPPRHMFGDTQSLADPHIVRQAPAPHMYGAHGWFAPGLHVPAPSHVGASDSVEPLQPPLPHTVPAA